MPSLHESLLDVAQNKSRQNKNKSKVVSGDGLGLCRGGTGAILVEGCWRCICQEKDKWTPEHVQLKEEDVRWCSLLSSTRTESSPTLFGQTYMYVLAKVHQMFFKQPQPIEFGTSTRGILACAPYKQ